MINTVMGSTGTVEASEHWGDGGGGEVLTDLLSDHAHPEHFQN